MSTVFEASYDELKRAEAEIERLRSLNAELVAAAEFLVAGHLDQGLEMIKTALAKVKEVK